MARSQAVESAINELKLIRKTIPLHDESLELIDSVISSITKYKFDFKDQHVPSIVAGAIILAFAKHYENNKQLTDPSNPLSPYLRFEGSQYPYYPKTLTEIIDILSAGNKVEKDKLDKLFKTTALFHKQQKKLAHLDDLDFILYGPVHYDITELAEKVGLHVVAGKLPACDATIATLMVIHGKAALRQAMLKAPTDKAGIDEACDLIAGMMRDSNLDNIIQIKKSTPHTAETKCDDLACLSLICYAIEITGDNLSTDQLAFNRGVKDLESRVLSNFIADRESFAFADCVKILTNVKTLSQKIQDKTATQADIDAFIENTEQYKTSDSYIENAILMIIGAALGMLVGALVGMAASPLGVGIGIACGATLGAGLMYTFFGRNEPINAIAQASKTLLEEPNKATAQSSLSS